VQENPESPFVYNSYGVACSEVEVDVLTGQTEVLRVDILYDCGERFRLATTDTMILLSRLNTEYYNSLNWLQYKP